MKRSRRGTRARASVLVAVAVASMACGASSRLPEPTLPLTPTPEMADSRAPDLPALEHALPPPVLQHLDNGLAVLSYERPAFPFVEIGLGLRAAHDYGGQSGLARFTALLLGHANPDLYRGDDEGLDVDAALVTLRGTRFWVRASSEELSATLESVSRLTRWPTLDSTSESAAAHDLSAFRETNWSTSRLRAAAIGQLYGPNSSLARFGFISEDAVFSVQQAREFHARRYVPSTSVLSFVGALSAPAAKELAQRYFGAWRASSPPEPPLRALTELPASGPLRTAVLNNHERKAAVVVVAMPCVPTSSPEGLALDFAAMLLGQSKRSRVKMELRHEGGNSYGVSAVCLQTAQTGTFLITFDSAPEKVGESITLLLAAAKQLGAGEIGSEELAAARGRLLASVWNAASSSHRLSAVLTTLHLDGQPLDYITRLPSRIQAMTATDIRDVARKYLDGTRVGVAVYGPAHVIVPQLRALGAVTW